MFNSIWYQNLNRPFLAPPNWVFAPVWTILYLLMFGAFVIYFITPDYNKKRGYIYFWVQLFLNFIWSPIFFYLQNIGFALFILILLDIFVFLTYKNFFKVSKAAGFLLLPYFLWVLFATYLNIGYFILN